MTHLRLIIVATGVALLLTCASVVGQEKSKGGAKESSDSGLVQSVKGPDLFRAYCASCHGVDANGNGPAGVILKVAPPDLTGIAERNHGKFPAERIARIIGGEDVMASHGSREMPLWGPIFHEVEKDQDWGEVRIHNLVEYLRSIQRPPTKTSPAAK